MKALIYAGIGLFSVASVYGIADYYQSQKKGTLSSLYKEDDEPVEVKKTTADITTIPVSTTNNKEVNLPTNNTKTVKVNKTVNARKRISLDDFSRGRILDPVKIETVLEEIPKELIEIKPEVVKPVKAVEEKLSEASGRTLSLEMFSRAPLKKRVKPVMEKRVTKN